jgi:Clostripain family
VRYFVGSEELVPGHSWPYREIFGALRANPDQGGADFAELVVKEYVNFYMANPPGAGDVTKVALDLNGITEVAHRLNALAAALLPKIDSQADALWNAQTKTRQYEEGPRKPAITGIDDRRTKFDYHLWDIGSLARELSTTDEDPSVKAAARSLREILSPGGSVVIAEGHCGSWFDGIGGVSIYLVPPLKQRISPYYGDLALSRDTKWLDLLRAYHEHYACRISD